MAVRINLLPEEKRVSGDLAQVLRIGRMLSVISLAGFLVFGFGLGAFFIFSSIQLNSVNKNNDSLKSQVSTLETSESRLVLLKDRLSKVKKIENLPSSIDDLNKFNTTLDALGGSTSLNELDIENGKITTTANFSSYQDLNSFIQSLSSNTAFSQVDVPSFGFNPSTGYLVNVSIEQK